METTLERLAHEASLRSLDKQEQVLAELRARTGLLLAASALAATLLEQPALEGAAPPLIGAAMGAFGVSIGASLYVLIPRKDLAFSPAGSAVYEGLFELRQDMQEVHRTLAYDLDRVWQANDKTMVRMLQGFGLRPPASDWKLSSFLPPQALPSCNRG